MKSLQNYHHPNGVYNCKGSDNHAQSDFNYTHNNVHTQRERKRKREREYPKSQKIYSNKEGKKYYHPY